MPPLVELDNVVKVYGTHQALGPLTVTLPETSIGLLGPNGSGKTTLIRLLLGLVPPTSGTLRVLGEDIREGGRSLRRRIGYVPEGDAVFPGLTGIEAVSYSGRLVGMTKPDSLQRAHQVIDYVELDEARYRLVETYSTGMRQRLKLAQALVHDPELLLLDEPTEGVDPEARGHLLELLSELEKEHGLRLLLSTHLLGDVERLTDYALVLHEGRAARQGRLSELKATASKAFLVRVTGSVQALTERLAGAGVRYESMEPNLRVDLEDPREILRHAEAAGVVVRHVAPLELTHDQALESAVRPAAAGGGTPA
ncbi:MAG: ABC transporter ATP-binding protein [Methanobacteriota archaeon]